MRVQLQISGFLSSVRTTHFQRLSRCKIKQSNLDFTTKLKYPQKNSLLENHKFIQNSKIHVYTVQKWSVSNRICIKTMHFRPSQASGACRSSRAIVTFAETKRRIFILFTLPRTQASAKSVKCLRRKDIVVNNLRFALLLLDFLTEPFRFSYLPEKDISRCVQFSRNMN